MSTFGLEQMREALCRIEALPQPVSLHMRDPRQFPADRIEPAPAALFGGIPIRADDRVPDGLVFVYEGSKLTQVLPINRNYRDLAAKVARVVHMAQSCTPTFSMPGTYPSSP